MIPLQILRVIQMHITQLARRVMLLGSAQTAQRWTRLRRTRKSTTRNGTMVSKLPRLLTRARRHVGYLGAKRDLCAARLRPFWPGRNIICYAPARANSCIAAVILNRWGRLPTNNLFHFSERELRRGEKCRARERRAAREIIDVTAHRTRWRETSAHFWRYDLHEMH